jgi:hypothetical protein
MPEGVLDERPKAVEKPAIYNFYNVLWIEWNGGVVFRKALGRVEKSAWES